MVFASFLGNVHFHSHTLSRSFVGFIVTCISTITNASCSSPINHWTGSFIYFKSPNINSIQVFLFILVFIWENNNNNDNYMYYMIEVPKLYPICYIHSEIGVETCKRQRGWLIEWNCHENDLLLLFCKS